VRRTGRHLGILVAVLILLLVPGEASSLIQDPKKIAERRERFARETDPVQKARRFPPLGEELMKLVHQQVRAEQYEAALRTLEEYYELARTAFTGLENSGRNAERQSSGFRQLQIHLRRSLRDLEQTILALPVPQRGPFEAIREQLEQMNQRLLEMLFPHRPRPLPENQPAPLRPSGGAR
jgi:hypothetical protein